jgi:hypothetical protein
MGISILAWLSSLDLYWPETARDGVEGQYGSRDDNQANMEMPMYLLSFFYLYGYT